MVKGSLYTVSRNHEANPKSSTKADLVAVDDCIEYVLSTEFFFLEQGYNTQLKSQSCRIIRVLSCWNKMPF